MTPAQELAVWFAATLAGCVTAGAITAYITYRICDWWTNR